MSVVQTETRCPHLRCTWSYVGDPERARGMLDSHLGLMHAGVGPGEGRAALDEMDRGEPVAATGSGVGANAGAVPAPDPTRNDPERPGTSGLSLTTARKSKKPYTRDEILGLFRLFHDQHGRWPLPSDRDDYRGLPSAMNSSLKKLGGWQGVWTALGAGKVPKARNATNYRNAGALADRGPKEPAAAAAETHRLTTPVEPPGSPPVASPTPAPVVAERGPRSANAPKPKAKSKPAAPEPNEVDDAPTFSELVAAFAVAYQAHDEAIEAMAVASEDLKAHPLYKQARDQGWL